MSWPQTEGESIMLKTLVKKFTYTAAGAITGAAVGTAMVPLYWGLDAISPVSYPVLAASAVACGFKGNSLSVSKPALVVGAAVGACLVPLTPINVVTRPVATPLWFSFMGALAGFTASNR